MLPRTVIGLLSFPWVPLRYTQGYNTGHPNGITKLTLLRHFTISLFHNFTVSPFLCFTVSHFPFLVSLFNHSPSLQVPQSTILPVPRPSHLCRFFNSVARSEIEYPL
jgi:hypothetical protein